MTRISRLLILLMLAAVAAACSRSHTDSCEQTDEARMHEYVIEGKVHYLDGEYNDALDVLYKYLELSSRDESVGNVDDVMNAYIMLGNIHLAFSDYVRAYSYYEEGLRLSRELASPENEVTFLNDLTIVSCYLDNRDQAMKYNETLADVKSKNPGLQRYLYLIGGAYIEKSFGTRAKAIDKMRSAISYIDREKLDPELKLSALSELSEYFEENNMLDSALAYLDTFERLAIESNSPALLADNKRRYMRVYTKLGDTQNALRYQEEYFIHQDSVLNPNRFINVSNRFQKESEERTGIVVQNLRKTVASQKLLIIVILFSTVILLLWLFFRHKERVANVQLFKRNRELAQIEEKVRKIEEEKLSALPQQPDAAAATPPEENARDGGDDAMPRMRELYDKILAVMAQPDHYCDPKFSLNRLAELTGSNTKYVSQSINDCTGKNFRTFINEYRIREARRRLLDTDNFGNVTIQFLAESVGFMSTSAFNMAFKKFTGMTPSLYQKMGRDADID